MNAILQMGLCVQWANVPLSFHFPAMAMSGGTFAVRNGATIFRVCTSGSRTHFTSCSPG